MASYQNYENHSGAFSDVFFEQYEKGLAPFSVAELMSQRVRFIDQAAKSKGGSGDYSFGTSDLIFYSPMDLGRIKLVFTTNNSGNLTENGRDILGMIASKKGSNGFVLTDGAIELTAQDYHHISGSGVLDFSQYELKSGDNRLDRTSFTRDRFWRRVLRHPDEVPTEFAYKGLVERVAEETFEKMKYFTQ